MLSVLHTPSQILPFQARFITPYHIPSLGDLLMNVCGTLDSYQLINLALYFDIIYESVKSLTLSLFFMGQED